MPSDDPGCPACRTPLRKDPLGRHSYRCQTCGGTLEGFYPFRSSLAEGLGQHLWVAAAEGREVEPCPYCYRPMRSPADGGEIPGGLGICRGCEQVWVPGSAASWVAAHADRGPDGAVARLNAPAECPNCGAPYEPDQDGRCRYCRVQLTTAPAAVIVFEQPSPSAHGGLWGLLDRPL